MGFGQISNFFEMCCTLSMAFKMVVRLKVTIGRIATRSTSLIFMLSAMTSGINMMKKKLFTVATNFTRITELLSTWVSPAAWLSIELWYFVGKNPSLFLGEAMYARTREGVQYIKEYGKTAKVDQDDLTVKKRLNVMQERGKYAGCRAQWPWLWSEFKVYKA